MQLLSASLSESSGVSALTVVHIGCVVGTQNAADARYDAHAENTTERESLAAGDVQIPDKEDWEHTDDQILNRTNCGTGDNNRPLVVAR